MIVPAFATSQCPCLMEISSITTVVAETPVLVREIKATYCWEGTCFLSLPVTFSSPQCSAIKI